MDSSGIDNLVPKWHRTDMQQATEEPRKRATSRVSGKKSSSMPLAYQSGKPRKRITSRVSGNVCETLEQAAQLLGSTVNQFVVQTAYVEAQRIIERESIIRLSQEDAQKVLFLLDHPPKPNKRLKDAIQAYKDTVRA